MSEEKVEYMPDPNDPESSIASDAEIAGPCLFCGKPVYIVHRDENGKITCVAGGTIQIDFGYGSRRDTDYGVGYIHDICAAKAEKMAAARLTWSNGIDPDAQLDLDKTIENNKVTYDQSKRSQSEDN